MQERFSKVLIQQRPMDAKSAARREGGVSSYIRQATPFFCTIDKLRLSLTRRHDSNFSVVSLLKFL